MPPWSLPGWRSASHEIDNDIIDNDIIDNDIIDNGIIPMTSSQRDRAEAAFGHMQHAATEVILAAHGALDILEEVVATAGLSGFLDRLNDVGATLLKRAWTSPGRGPAAGEPSGAEPEGDPEADPIDDEAPAAPASRVVRIPVR